MGGNTLWWLLPDRHNSDMVQYVAGVSLVSFFSKNQISFMQLYSFLTIVIVLVWYLWLLLRVQVLCLKVFLQKTFTLKAAYLC